MSTVDQSTAGYLSGNFDRWVWNVACSRTKTGGLSQAYAAATRHAGQEQLTLWTIIGQTADPLRSIASRAKRALVQLAASDDVSALLVQVPDQDPFVVACWKTDAPGVFHLSATVPVTDGRWQRFERWVRAASPDVSAFYLDGSHFEEFIETLEHLGRVTASRVTSRRRSDRSSDAKGYPAPMPASAALEEVEEGSQVRTITLAVGVGDENLLRMHLRRLAGATFYSGDFGKFHELVLDRLTIVAAARIGLLVNRQRRVDEDEVLVQPSPLAVRLDSGYFSSIDRTQLLIERMGAYSHGEVAVMHRNPYLHLSVADYTDGSNYDIFVTDADEIVVYGGFQSTVGALARLTEYLSDEFSAQELSEHRPERPNVSLQELFAPI